MGALKGNVTAVGGGGSGARMKGGDCTGFSFCFSAFLLLCFRCVVCVVQVGRFWRTEACSGGGRSVGRDVSTLLLLSMILRVVAHNRSASGVKAHCRCCLRLLLERYVSEGKAPKVS